MAVRGPHGGRRGEGRVGEGKGWEGKGRGKGKGMGRGREGERGRGGGGGGRGGKGKGEERGWEGREREKIVALWQANRQIIDFKILPTKIFKLNFLENKKIAVCGFFTHCRGVDCLSMCKFFGKSMFRKNIRELFSKNFRGALNLRGDPEPTKVQGDSLEGVEFYKAVKRSRRYLPRNSRY